jgi:heat shock protein HslJ
VEPGLGEAMCCASRLAQKIFAVRTGALRLVSSTVTGALSIATLGQVEWTLVEMDGKTLPAGARPPTIRFDSASASGFSGCNRFTGGVQEKGARRTHVRIARRNPDGLRRPGRRD